MSTNKVGPIIYAFSSHDIKSQKMAGFLALFGNHCVTHQDSALQLLNSLHIGFDIPKLHTRASFERPHVRSFCKRLVQECPVLPWVAALSTQLYREIIYATLPDIQITYSDKSPGEYVTRYCVEEMQALIDSQTAAIETIGKQAQIAPETIQKRAKNLAFYLESGQQIIS